jgi:hypothetical protein
MSVFIQRWFGVVVAPQIEVCPEKAKKSYRHSGRSKVPGAKSEGRRPFFGDLRPLLYREEGTLHPAGSFAALKLGAPLFTFEEEGNGDRLNDGRSPRSSAVHPAAWKSGSRASRCE